MQHETTLEYTVPLLREAVRGFWYRTVGIGMFLAPLFCAAALAFQLSQGERSWVVGVTAAGVLFGVVFVVSVYVVHYKNSIRKFRSMGSPSATFQVTGDSFTVSSAAGTTTLPWSSVTELW